jgi:hypothetical protein
MAMADLALDAVVESFCGMNQELCIGEKLYRYHV